MLEEEGIVLSVNGDTAEVVAQAKSACGSCSARSGCGTSLLAGMFPERKRSFLASNTVSAREGDRVIIGLDESAMQIASLMVYLAPLLGLIGGAILGNWLMPSLLSGFGEFGSIAMGIAGFVLVLMTVRKISPRLSENSRYQARILRILRVSPISVDGIKLASKEIDGK